MVFRFEAWVLIGLNDGDLIDRRFAANGPVNVAFVAFRQW